MLDPKDYTAAHLQRSHAVDLRPLAQVLARHGHQVDVSIALRTDTWWTLIDVGSTAAIGVALIPKPDDAPEGGIVGVSTIMHACELKPQDKLLGVCAQVAIHIWWSGYFGRYMIAYVGDEAGELEVAVSAPHGTAVGNFAWRDDGEALLAVVMLCADDELRADVMAQAPHLKAPLVQ